MQRGGEVSDHLRPTGQRHQRHQVGGGEGEGRPAEFFQSVGLKWIPIGYKIKIKNKIKKRHIIIIVI